MADARLRNLERQAAQGDIQARARLLCERVRVRDLDPQKLRLAAYLGDPASCLVLIDEDVNPDKLDPLDFHRSVQYMSRWGNETSVRAAVAVAEYAIAFIEKEDPGFDLMHTAVQAVKAWIRCPRRRQLLAVRKAEAEILRLEKVSLHRVCDPWESMRDINRIFLTVINTCGVITNKVTFYAATGASIAANWSVDISQKSRTDNPSNPLPTSDVFRRRIWKAISQALIPWALGEGDPPLWGKIPRIAERAGGGFLLTN